MPDGFHNVIPVLSIVVAALIPGIVAVTLQGKMAWYSGIGLFYGSLSVAEMGYLAVLFVLHRMGRPARYRTFP